MELQIQEKDGVGKEMNTKQLIWIFALIFLINLVNAGNVTLNTNNTASLNLILGDAFVREDLGGNDNLGNNDDLSTEANDNAAERTYIKFNLTILNDIDYILNSTLILVEDNNFASNTMNVRLHEVYLNGTIKWCEGNGGNNNDAQLCSSILQNGTYEITWNNQPCGTTENNIGISGNCSGMHIENKSLSNTNGNTTFDITSLFVKYLRDKIFSIILVADNEALNPGSNIVQYESKEEAGTGLAPRLNVTYVILPPNSSLINLISNQSFVNGSTINFTCSAIDDTDLRNVTLYHNINGSFAANQSANIFGISNSSNFSINSIVVGNYMWNCLACNKYGACEFNNTNFTFVINQSVSGNIIHNITLTNPTESPANGIAYLKDRTYYFNITITNSSEINNTIIAFNNTNYTSISNLDNIYTFLISDIAASTYNYQWHGYLINGTSNKSELKNYTVNKANSSVNLTLNNNHNNITVNISENVNISTILVGGVGNISIFDSGDLIAIGINPSLNVSYSFNGTHEINATYLGDENYTNAYDTLTITVVNNALNLPGGNEPQQGSGSSPSSGLSPSDSGIKKVEEIPGIGKYTVRETPEQSSPGPREIQVAEGAPSEPAGRSLLTGAAIGEITEEPKGLFKDLVGAFIRPLQNKNTGGIILFIILILIIYFLVRKRRRKRKTGSLKEWKVIHQETYDVNLKPIKFKESEKREFIREIKREIVQTKYEEIPKQIIKKPIVIKKFINIKEKEKMEKPIFNPLRKINKEGASKKDILNDLKKVYKIE